MSLRVLAVTNMYPTPANRAAGTFVEQQVVGLRAAGVEVEVLVVDRAGRGASAYRGLSGVVEATARGFRADLVHVMYGGVMADQVARAALDAPWIVSFCGSDLLGENLSGPVRKVISRYGVLCSHRAARRAGGVIVKSRNLLNALPASVDRRKTRILPNGVDLERFRPLDRAECRARLGWGEDALHVLFPANSGDPVKRFPLARAAAEEAGRQGLRVELHALRGVPHAEVPVWINAADAVIMTSLQEGSPNIIKETLASDVPVVSIDVGDVAERIEGLTGCYLARAEPEDIAAGLLAVSRGSRRVDGRTRMAELSLSRVAERLLEFYEELAGAGKEAACRRP